jgi:acyl carrier protein
MTDTEKLKFIEDAILKLMKKTVVLNPANRLADLDLDSLEIVELQMYYEELTSNEIDNDASIITVGDLMTYMK